MPYVWEDPEVLVTLDEKNDVRIYCIYKNDFADAPVREYHYSFSPHGSDDDEVGDNGCFDVRKLPKYFEGCKHAELLRQLWAAQDETLLQMKASYDE